MKKQMTLMAKNDSEDFSRANLAHAVSTMGAALRSLHRIKSINVSYERELLDNAFGSLEYLLKDIREKEKNEREAK
jgi:hypothetical protein